MASLMNSRVGRPSKGPRHTFVVKLDMERAVKLVEILGILNVNGIEYLTPLIEDHVDSIDLGKPHEWLQERRIAGGKNTTTTETLPLAVRRKRNKNEENLRRTQTLSLKVNLLLDAIPDASGQPYVYPKMKSGAEKVGVSVSRTRWSLLKNGQPQAVPDTHLRAIAAVFGVDPEYLLHDDAPIPPKVKAMLPQVRIKRLTEVHDFAARALGPVDPNVFAALANIIDEAIEL